MLPCKRDDIFFLHLHLYADQAIQAGRCCCKGRKKTELYVSGGSLDEGHHIFSGEPFEPYFRNTII